MYGMSSKEFWEDDPKLYWAYRTFYFKELEYKEQENDYNCWLQGLYNYNALTQALIGAFGDDKSKANAHYLEKPLLMQKEDKGKIIDPNIKQQEDFNKWARF